MITGSSGKLGTQLCKLFPEADAPPHKEMDITDFIEVSEYIERFRPDLLFHAAALTSVRECEGDPDLAWQINVGGTRNLVDSCLKYCPETYFVYISTACIFSGKEGDYNEQSIPDPKNYYSLTKLVGECVPRILNKWLVVRTNFVAKEPWPYPRAFTDRYGTYLFADDVAKAIREVTDSGITEVVHITGDRKMSIFTLARMVSPNVKPMRLDEYEGPPLTVDMSLTTVRWKKHQISEVK